MEVIFIGIFIASIVALDTTHAFQIQISQPIFACTLLGIIFNQPEIGIAMGIIFELVYLNILPIGGNAFPENNMAAMSATILLISLVKGNPEFASYYWIIAIGMGLILAYVDMKITVYHRHWNSRFLLKLESESQSKILSSRDFIKIIIFSMIHYVFFMFLINLILVLGIYLIVEEGIGSRIGLLPEIPFFFWVLVFSIMGITSLYTNYFRKN